MSSRVRKVGPSLRVKLPQWAQKSPAVVALCAVDRVYRMKVMSADRSVRTSLTLVAERMAAGTGDGT